MSNDVGFDGEGCSGGWERPRGQLWSTHRVERQSSGSGSSWHLLPILPLLQIPSDVAFRACLRVCRASWLTQPPARPQFSLTGVPMFKRGVRVVGERLVAGKELASVSIDTMCCCQRPGAWNWLWLWVMKQRVFLGSPG